MQRGILAKTFSEDSMEMAFKKIHEMGYECLQFNFVQTGLSALPLNIPEAIVDKIISVKEKFELKIAGVSGTFNMAHPKESVRQKGLEALASIASVVIKLDCDIISICTGSRNEENMWAHHADNNSAAAWEDMKSTLRKSIKIAAEFNIFLGIEPEMGNVINSTLKARQILDELKSDRLKIILDPANLFEQAQEYEIKWLIDEALELLGNDLCMIHAKDRDKNGDFVAPGKGIIPFNYFIEKLNKIPFNGPVIAHGFPEKDAEFVADYLEKLFL